MKKFTSIALVVAMLFAVSACNANPSETEAETTTTVEETTEETTEATTEETTEETTVSPADEEPTIVEDEDIINIINNDPSFEGIADEDIPSNIVFSDWRFTSYKGLTFDNAASTTDLRSNVSAPIYAAGDTVKFSYISIGYNVPLTIASCDINDDGSFNTDSLTILAYGLSDKWNGDCYPLVNDVNFSFRYSDSFSNSSLPGNGSFTIPSDSTGKIYFIFDCRNMETLNIHNVDSTDELVTAILDGNYFICAPIVVE